MEIVIDNKEDVPETIKQIEEVARELGLKTMSNDESKEFMKKILTGWERGPYSRDEFKSKKIF
jgi:galactokinase/mevalonate kinase-like predicted kinase